jgi:signal transduction histidine kinase
VKGLPDLSIGQRLAVGFGLFMAVVAVMLVVFLQWHANSVEAHSRYADRIAPLSDRVHTMERRIYAVGITLRSVLLEPTPGRMQRFAESASEARTALGALGDFPMEEDGRALYYRFSSSAQRYVQTAEDLVRRRSDGELDLDDERRIAQLRETLLNEIAQFASLQQSKADAALNRIADIGERTSRGLVVLVISTGVILTFLAWLTARSISRPTQQLLRTVGALREGNWKPALALAPSTEVETLPPARDEMRQLGHAFGRAALALERREQRLRADGLVAQAVSSSLERDGIAQAALQEIIEHLRVEVGVLYAAPSGSEQLVPVASHALSRDLAPIKIGDGIPGQAALRRRTVILTDIPVDSPFQVKLGYDQAIPKALAAVPLLFRDTLHGVLVVGSLRELSPDAIEFLRAAATQLGIGLQNVAAYEQIQKLLADLREYNERIQAQNEELQVQNEEIQAQNEEIQAQNEEIQAQSEQLQAQHEELQAQNEELTQQSEELRRHASELAEADERKNKFLGILAHELRNPMAPIANSIHILKRSVPGSEGALRAQAVIERQAAHLVRLIDDLLDVTRISEGKIHIKRERLDLVEVTRVCVEDHTAAFEQAGITLDLDLPNTPVEILGDHTRLCQVFGNLLNNSMKFNDRDGMVQLSLRVDHAAGAAVLRVSDNGIGMEPELLPQLFQPFSQGISGLARTKGGLGLGLALVKALVGLHEGSVVAHSDGPGNGAEFTVRLPLASAQAALQREHATQPAASTDAKTDRAHRVLIVEDNLDAARTLQEALRIEGYDVIAVHTGAEALEAVKSFAPDVVLCDIGLPDMDGHDVARELRANPSTASSILIALTGYASTEDKQQAASAGFDLHLAKPLKISGLEQVLAGFPVGRPVG